MFRSDYYSVLGLSRGAGSEDISRAYRRLVRLWHPDVNPSSAEAEERLRLLIEAYEVLKDSVSRARYDAFLEDSRTPCPPPTSNFSARIPRTIKARKRTAIAPGLAVIALISAVIFLAVKLWPGDPIPIEWTRGAAPSAFVVSGYPYPETSLSVSTMFRDKGVPKQQTAACHHTNIK